MPSYLQLLRDLILIVLRRHLAHLNISTTPSKRRQGKEDGGSRGGLSYLEVHTVSTLSESWIHVAPDLGIGEEERR